MIAHSPSPSNSLKSSPTSSGAFGRLASSRFIQSYSSLSPYSFCDSPPTVCSPKTPRCNRRVGDNPTNDIKSPPKFVLDSPHQSAGSPKSSPTINVACAVSPPLFPSPQRSPAPSNCHFAIYLPIPRRQLSISQISTTIPGSYHEQRGASHFNSNGVCSCPSTSMLLTKLSNSPSRCEYTSSSSQSSSLQLSPSQSSPSENDSLDQAPHLFKGSSFDNSASKLKTIRSPTDVEQEKGCMLREKRGKAKQAVRFLMPDVMWPATIDGDWEGNLEGEGNLEEKCSIGRGKEDGEGSECEKGDKRLDVKGLGWQRGLEYIVE